jgi:hypothetical protein
MLQEGGGGFQISTPNRFSGFPSASAGKETIKLTEWPSLPCCPAQVSKRTRHIVLGLVVVVALSFVLLLLWAWRTPAAPPLPSPNGYDDLLRAGSLVKGNLDDVEDLKETELRTLLETNVEPLLLARLGLSRECVVPTGTAIVNFGSGMNDMISLKGLAKLLVADGRLKELENHPGDAAQSYAEAIKLGSAMSHGGLMINRSVGIACEGLGGIFVVRLVPKLTCEQIRPLISSLGEIDKNTVSWTEILHNENRFVRSQMGSYPNPIKLASDLWQARTMRRVSKEKHYFAAAKLRLLTVELALRCHRIDQRTPPERLDQLVPKYLQHVPKDPFSGASLFYRPMGTNWLAYSIGPDRTDDGGKPIGRSGFDYLVGFGTSSKKSIRQGDVLYDSPW